MSGRRHRIDAGWIIAFDGHEHRAIRDGSLLIEGNSVSYVGPRSAQAADEVWTLPYDIVSPGFVSLHSHLAFGAVDRSFREDCRSDGFYGSTLFEYVLPLMRATASTSAVAIATRLSMIELMRSGVTTSLDIVDGPPAATIAAAEDTGIRIVVGETFTSLKRVVKDGVRVDYEPAQDISDEHVLDEVVERALEVAGSAGGLADVVIAPGAVDTCHPELLRRSAAIAREHGLRMTTHCCQSRHEVHEILRRHGETPVEHLDRCGFLGPDVILAHCVFIDGHSQVGALRDGRDLELLGRSATTVAHSPTQFARTGSRLEDFVSYRRAGVGIGMAVDAAPQCMLAEMRFAAMLGKVGSNPQRYATARAVFDAATVDAANALGRSDLGRLAVGSKADLVVFKGDSPALAVMRDPIKSIVYHASPRDVRAVVVNGAQTVRDGEAARLDVAALARELRETCEEQIWPSFTEITSRSIDELAPLSITEFIDADDGRA